MTAYPHALPSNLKDSEHDHFNRFGFFFQAGRIGKSQGDGFAECFLRLTANGVKSGGLFILLLAIRTVRVQSSQRALPVVRCRCLARRN